MAVFSGTNLDDIITPSFISSGVTVSPPFSTLIGNDIINGGAGNDTINGGDGNDTINGGDGNDIINAGVGNDIINAGVGNDTINGGLGKDIINAGVGNDIINGGAGKDIINGGAGDDIINGGAGDDNLTGGDGNDTLTGGGGNDTFVFKAGFGADIITDFQDGLDLIDLTAFGNSSVFSTLNIIPNPASGTNVLITSTLTGFGSITLQNFTGTLDQSDFLFM
jgi:Ca2+-binding RTX toxin-like protein